MTADDGPPHEAATTEPPALIPADGPEPTPQEVGARIRELRERPPKMSQRRLGVAVGKSEKAVWLWEKGHVAIEWPHLKRLGAVFGVDPHVIYGKVRHPQEDPPPVDWRLEEAREGDPATRMLSARLLADTETIREELRSLRVDVEALTRLSLETSALVRALGRSAQRPESS